MRRFVLAALALVAAPVAAETHPFNVRDLIAFDRLTDPAVSPDGKRVAFTVSSLDLDANKRRTDLWMVDVAGGEPRRLTTHEASDASAAWSRDGRHVYFLSTRSGSAQVWRISVSGWGGGEAEAVTRLPLDVESFRLAPDGARLAVSVLVFPTCADIACTRKRLDEEKAKKSTGHVYDNLLYRHWDEWSDGRRAHLLVMSLTDATGARAVDVMKGLVADCPSRPFGDIDEFVFTPDGRGLVFSARVAGREEAWSTNFDLYQVPLDGSAAPRNLTAKNPAGDSGPLFSPDGKTLLWRAMKRPGYEADRQQIMARDWPDGAPRAIAADWDRSPDDLAFSADGKTLFAVADDGGQRSLFAIDVAAGKARPLASQGHATAARVAGDRVVFLLDSLRGPAELHSVRPDGSDLRPVTHINAHRLKTVRLGDAEPFTFAGAGGDTVHAWIVKPVDFDARKKYPVALLIHGGPQGSFSNNFHYRWNPQAYAGAGYAAVMIDFHGSTGYGQAFTDAIGDDWGGKPLVDLQKGLEAALQKYPFLDGARACALGASYGGYMVNWIAGTWPDRFKCLVSHDGNLDERMAYYDTEELWFPEWEHRGAPWDNPDGYSKHNPIELVKKWKTPMLVIHGGRDYRVVETQGMSTFTALQRRNIPSRMLHFPDENHWVLKPANSILWHDTVLGWLDRWTR